MRRPVPGGPIPPRTDAPLGGLIVLALAMPALALAASFPAVTAAFVAGAVGSRLLPRLARAVRARTATVSTGPICLPGTGVCIEV